MFAWPDGIYAMVQIEHHVWPSLSALSYQRGQAELQEICGKLWLRLAGGDGLGEGKVWRGRGLQDESAMWNNLGSVLRVFGFSISGV